VRKHSTSIHTFVVGVVVLLAGSQLRAATRLTGTWLLVTMSVDKGQWRRPAIDTEVVPPAFHDESLTIEIEGDDTSPPVSV